MSTTHIIPTMKYHDAPAAIDWLHRAFGFEKRMVVQGEGGLIDHAELELGGSMIMLGSFRGNDFERKMRTPADLGGLCTQSAYVVIEDVDAVYACAKAAGAEIYLELQEPGYGGKMFSCIDPEGQIWTFGSYDPWKANGND